MNTLPSKYHNQFIVGILECSSKYKYGYSSNKTPLYMCYPLHKELKDFMFLVGSNVKDVSKNYLCLIRYLHWNDKYPRGELIRIIGECGDWKTEREALVWQYSPYNFKTDKYSNKNNLLDEENKAENLCDWETLNIDPLGCEDIDDCISYKIDDDKTLSIAITIANVSRIVNLNSDVNNQASLLCQTLYYNEGRKSMLPKDYEQECSLKLNQERYGVSLIFKYPTFNNLRFVETKLINKETHTYESIYSSKHTQLIEFLREFSGSEDSHKWVESLMIYYNKEAVKILNKNKIGIYKIHKQKNTENELMEKYCPFLLNESSRYSLYTEELNHFGMGLKEYATFTSPIRRYTDLVNQRYLLNPSINLEIDIELINYRNSEIKRFNREIFFLNLVQNNIYKEIKGLILNISNEKIKVYIDEWKRVISIKNSDSLSSLEPKELKEEDVINIRYFYNSKEKNWKSRIIFEIL
jgi:exoribonuclease R